MKSFYQRFFHLSRAKQIALSVVFAHLAILVALITHHLITCQWRTPKPILVKTIVPTKPAPVLVATIPKVAESQIVNHVGHTPPKPNTAPTTKTTSSSSKPAEKPKSIAQKTTKESKSIAAPTNTWKDIADTLNTITKDEPKKLPPSVALHVPTKTSSPSLPPLEDVSYTEDPTYGEYLTAFLQNTLELPEYGDVKIQVEIDGFGQLVHCQILETKSKKNATFLQETLPSLHFPIPQLGPFENTKTISINFRNK